MTLSPEAAMRSIGQGLEPAATGPRERVLGEAFILFYVQGIRAVGIDLLIAQSGIAKASFYRHFPSKNDLVVAYVERRSEALLTWLAGRIEERASTAPDRLLAIFDALGDLFDDPEYRGCPIINVVAEVGHESPQILERAVAHKVRLHDLAVALATESAVARAGDLADQWLLLIDGAFVAAQRVPGRRAAAVARRAAEVLLMGSGGPPPKRPTAKAPSSGGPGRATRQGGGA